MRRISLASALLIPVGVLCLGLAGWELVGTDLVAAPEQERVVRELEPTLPTTPAPVPTASATRTPGPAIPGTAFAVLRIKAIGLSVQVYEGTDTTTLRKGVGHYAGTELAGNYALAGHRTTYGRPFNRLGDLVKGDRIELLTRDGILAYEVTGTEVVDPTATWVLDQSDTPQLTLTTCHPEFSSRERLIVHARLVTK